MSDAALDIDGPDEETEAPAVAEAPTETPEAPPEPPKVEFNDDQQRVMNDAIGKKVAKQREAERQAEELQRQLQEQSDELAKLKQPQRPDVPAAPDPYSDNYDQEMAERDAAMGQQLQYDAQAKFAQDQQNATQQAAYDAAIEAQNKTSDAYKDRAEKLGVAGDTLVKAGATVGNYGLDPSITMHILADDQGPSLTVFLADNPTELEAVRQMSPMQAAVYLETQVKPKAVAARPGVNATPAPVASVSGGGFPEKEDGLANVTYE